MSENNNRVDIKEFADLHSAVMKHDPMTHLYRGEKDTECKLKLTPKIGPIDKLGSSEQQEEQQTKEYRKAMEMQMFEMFKNRAIAYLPTEPQPRDDWEWLAIAQHHGFPTRLLDWTRNPLVAAYFAVEEYHEGDRVIYAFKSENAVNIHDNQDPFDDRISKVTKYIDLYRPRN